MFFFEKKNQKTFASLGRACPATGSVQVEGLTGAALAEAVQALADQVGGIRAELFGDTDEEDAAEEEEEEEEEEEDEAAAPAS
jgi:hypothetical protein